MQIYNQRDVRWKDIPLGTGNLTIGEAGCTITSVGMLADITPDEVNIRLLSVGGYAHTNLIIWSKIKAAIPWLEHEWRGYIYDNDKVSKAIADNGGCLVEVDFDGTPRTSDRHWVTFIGNKKMYDPWTGTEEATSKYPILTGYSIIKVKENNMPTPLEQCHIDRKKFWNERDELHRALGKDSQADALKEIERLQQVERDAIAHVCPIVPPDDNLPDLILNGVQKEYTQGSTKITENYAVKG